MAAAKEGFNEDLLTEGSFSQLLDIEGIVGLDLAEGFIYPSSFSTENPPNMICFRNICNQRGKGFSEQGIVAQKSVITGSDSSSTSSSNNSSNSSISKSKKSQGGDAKIKTEQIKQNGSSLGSVPGSSLGLGALNESRKFYKKPKTENPTSTGTVKVRKEKLGERITALQQLVSPYGKTDTASVLHEAMGYIRFLHDQVQVLSSPYMQRLPLSGRLHKDGREKEEESRYDLRSRGLCLVPVACTVNVASSNGADFWSPAMGSNSSKH